MALIATPAVACGTRPRTLSADEVRDYSQVIVRGEFKFAYNSDPDSVDWLSGTVFAESVAKGERAVSYPVQHAFMQFYCRGAGWFPDQENASRSYTGEFLLRRRHDNRYEILGYKP